MDKRDLSQIDAALSLGENKEIFDREIDHLIQQLDGSLGRVDHIAAGVGPILLCSFLYYLFERTAPKTESKRAQMRIYFKEMVDDVLGRPKLPAERTLT